MWTYSQTSDWIRRQKHFQKKRARKLIAALNNLDAFFKTLEKRVKPREAKFGFVHPEPLGVFAIDQKGGGQSLAQLRAYVDQDEDEEILHLLTIGDKTSQQDDIPTCKQYVAQIRREDKKTDEPEKGSH
jgi:putative component of toxin-antitoxin plasmid stabilization module